MEYIGMLMVGVLIGIAGIKLYPMLKDMKITDEEKAKVQLIVIDTLKDIVSVASNTKSKPQLVLAITNITMNKLEKENIDGFSKEEIELIVNGVVNKLEDVIVKEK